MDTRDTIEVLFALAQPSRLNAFRLVMANEPDGIPAGAVAEMLGVPQNTLSTHLSVLSRAGLLTSVRRGRSIIYRAEVSRIQQLAAFLIEDCCGGRPDLCTMNDQAGSTDG